MREKRIEWSRIMENGIGGDSWGYGFCVIDVNAESMDLDD